MTEDDFPGALPAMVTSPNLCPINLVRGASGIGWMDQEPGQLRFLQLIRAELLLPAQVILGHQTLVIISHGCLVRAPPIVGNEGRKKGPKVGVGGESR